MKASWTMNDENDMMEVEKMMLMSESMVLIFTAVSQSCCDFWGVWDE
jgi:hypothetical protein